VIVFVGLPPLFIDSLAPGSTNCVHVWQKPDVPRSVCPQDLPLRSLTRDAVSCQVLRASSSWHNDDTHRSAFCCIPSYLITSRALLVYDVLAFCVALRLTKSANGSYFIYCRYCGFNYETRKKTCSCNSHGYSSQSIIYSVILKSLILICVYI
jgi:hypothetical protein